MRGLEKRLISVVQGPNGLHCLGCFFYLCVSERESDGEMEMDDGNVKRREEWTEEGQSEIDGQ